jgi:hypothetical protein
MVFENVAFIMFFMCGISWYSAVGYRDRRIPEYQLRISWYSAVGYRDREIPRNTQKYAEIRRNTSPFLDKF